MLREDFPEICRENAEAALKYLGIPETEKVFPITIEKVVDYITEKKCIKLECKNSEFITFYRKVQRNVERENKKYLELKQKVLESSGSVDVTMVSIISACISLTLDSLEDDKSSIEFKIRRLMRNIGILEGTRTFCVIFNILLLIIELKVEKGVTFFDMIAVEKMYQERYKEKEYTNLQDLCSKNFKSMDSEKFKNITGIESKDLKPKEVLDVLSENIIGYRDIKNEQEIDILRRIQENAKVSMNPSDSRFLIKIVSKILSEEYTIGSVCKNVDILVFKLDKVTNKTIVKRLDDTKVIASIRKIADVYFYCKSKKLLDMLIG